MIKKMGKFGIFALTAMLCLSIWGVVESRALTITYTPSPQYKGSIYYQRLQAVELTGDPREDIIRVALSQKGYHEGYKLAHLDGMFTESDDDNVCKNYSEYAYWYINNVIGLGYSDWCAMFVSWCARQAGVPTSVINNACRAGFDGSIYAFKDTKPSSIKYPSSGYVPMRGDMIFFNWEYDTVPRRWSHVGLVYDVVGDWVFTVEGNSTHQVMCKAYKLDSPYIKAYFVPAYTGVAESEHNFGRWQVKKMSTCVDAGTKTRTCLDCGLVENGVMDPLWHQFEIVRGKKKYTVDKAATCGQAGQQSFHCMRCSYTTGAKAIPALSHSYELKESVPATCSAEGKKVYVCKNDSKHTYTEKVAKLAHTPTDWIVEKEPTYYEVGKRYKECAVCKAVILREDIPIVADTAMPTGSVIVGDAASDAFSEIISTEIFSPTQLNVTLTGADEGSGLKSVEYYISNAVLSLDGVKAVAQWKNGTSFTVTEDGEYVVYGKITDKQDNVTYISSVGFAVDSKSPVISGITKGKTYCVEVDFAVNEKNVVVTTQSGIVTPEDNGKYYIRKEGAYTLTATDRAGNSTTVSFAVNKSHTPGEFVKTKEPTCTESGKLVKKCTVCENVVQTEAIAALGHDEGKWETQKAATCTEDGIRLRKCTRCKHVIETVEEKAQGHLYDRWIVTKAATCTESGSRERYCEKCGILIDREEIPSRGGHTPGEWVIQQSASCTENGSMIKYCTECFVELRRDVITAIGHSYGDWEMEVEPSCTQAGRYVIKCKNCSEVKDEKIVEASGHKFSLGKCKVCGLSTTARNVVISLLVVATIVVCVATFAKDIGRKRAAASSEAAKRRGRM